MCYYIKKVYACDDWTWERYSRECKRPTFLSQPCTLKLADPLQKEEIDDEACPLCYLHERRRSRVYHDLELLNEWFEFEGSKANSLQKKIEILEKKIEEAQQDLARLRDEREKTLQHDTMEMTWFIAMYDLWDSDSHSD